jgi:hypothetical protein
MFIVRKTFELYIISETRWTVTVRLTSFGKYRATRYTSWEYDNRHRQMCMIDKLLVRIWRHWNWLPYNSFLVKKNPVRMREEKCNVCTFVVLFIQFELIELDLVHTSVKPCAHYPHSHWDKGNIELISYRMLMTRTLHICLSDRYQQQNYSL